MSPFTLLGIAVGLSMDAFAVAIACGLTLRAVSPRHVFRLAFHFGLFQGIMPILGWLAGRGAHEWIARWDHWVAFGLLVYVGGKAILDSLRKKEDSGTTQDPTRGTSLVMLSLATSMDALAVGLTLGALSVSIWYPALVIGICTASLTACGIIFAHRIGSRKSQVIEIAGGLILIAIGLRIFISHLLSG